MCYEIQLGALTMSKSLGVTRINHDVCDLTILDIYMNY